MKLLSLLVLIISLQVFADEIVEKKIIAKNGDSVSTSLDDRWKEFTDAAEMKALVRDNWDMIRQLYADKYGIGLTMFLNSLRCTGAYAEGGLILGNCTLIIETVNFASEWLATIRVRKYTADDKPIFEISKDVLHQD